LTEAHSPSVSIVIPTLGRSPYLDECLEHLRAAGGHDLEIVVVAQGAKADDLQIPLADLVIRRSENLGFAGGCNLGISQSRGDYVGLVNDDAFVDREWLPALCLELDKSPSVAAVQGVNVQRLDPTKIDGCGIGWNRFWRPVQLGFGAPTSEFPQDAPSREVFGVSGTACLFRRSALESVRFETGVFLDPTLESYYEDVELAVRLRQEGRRTLLVPSARAEHVGSVTSRQFPEEHITLLTSNRYLVIHRLFGRSSRPYLRALKFRDGIEFLGALARGRAAACRGILAGRKRAKRLLPVFEHSAPPALTRGELAPFQVRRAGAFR